MAKSKEQKQLEAKFRQVRGELIDVYRETSSDYSQKIIDKLLSSDIENLDPIEFKVFNNSGILKRVAQIKKLKENFSTYPLELQIKAFNGWNIDGIEDLKLFRIEIEKKHLLSQVSTTDSSIKIKKRI